MNTDTKKGNSNERKSEEQTSKAETHTNLQKKTEIA